MRIDDLVSDIGCFVFREIINSDKPKMWFMYILSWVAMIIQICFVTLAIGKLCVNGRFSMYFDATYRLRNFCHGRLILQFSVLNS